MLCESTYLPAIEYNTLSELLNLHVVATEKSLLQNLKGVLPALPHTCPLAYLGKISPESGSRNRHHEEGGEYHGDNEEPRANRHRHCRYLL